MDELSSTLKKFSLENIFIFFILIIVPLAFRALAWKNLLQEASFKDSFLMINEGYFLNNLIPRSGEIARVFFANSICKISGFHSAAAIIFERGLDIIIAASLFLSTISFVIDLDWLQPFALALIIIFLCAIFGILILSANALKVKTWLENNQSSLGFVEKKLKPIVIKGIVGISGFANPKNLIKSIFWIICSWVFWVGLLVYALRLINPEAPVWWAIFAEGVLALGIAMPSAPASLGVYEGTMVIALSILGIEKTEALSTAIILHSLQIIITSLIGIIGLSVHGLSLIGVINTISNSLKKNNKNQGINE